MLKLILFVSLGGALGSLLRFFTGVVLSKYVESPFPIATLAVNITGCFLIGFFYSLSQRYAWFTPTVSLLLVTGFCGGLTTFSTFAYENFRLLQDGHTQLFLLYSVASFVFGLLAAVAGINVLRLF